MDKAWPNAPLVNPTNRDITLILHVNYPDKPFTVLFIIFISELNFMSLVILYCKALCDV